MKLLKWIVVFVVGLIALALTGCGPSTAQMTVTVQAAQALTLTAAPTITVTPSPTLTQTPTPTATITPTPTATETPTITPSPTSDRVIPGSYGGGGCDSVVKTQGGELTFCVDSVIVEKNNHMIFHVSWRIANLPSGVSVTKRSDQGNQRMYLIDNFGKRYDHSTGGDGAYSSVPVRSGVPITGWFDFGVAGVGAFTFSFHDDDNELVIDGISLYPGTGAASVSYENFPLDSYPLLLQYSAGSWDVTKADDASSKLINKAMPVCTIQVQENHAASGEFKSQVPVGVVTYDIYGYFDETAQFYVREYIYVSGLRGLDAKVRPFFYVTIPADNTTNCILAVSNVLSSLALNKP